MKGMYVVQFNPLKQSLQDSNSVVDGRTQCSPSTEEIHRREQSHVGVSLDTDS